jgi:hypothetical protein
VENIFGPVRFRLIQVSLYFQDHYIIYLEEVRRAEVASHNGAAAEGAGALIRREICRDPLLPRTAVSEAVWC